MRFCRWPANLDEFHEALMLMGAVNTNEVKRLGPNTWETWFNELQCEGRAILLERDQSLPSLIVASERYAELRALWPDELAAPSANNTMAELFPALLEDEAVVALIRARLDCSGRLRQTLLRRPLGLSRVLWKRRSAHLSIEVWYFADAIRQV